MVSTCCGRLRLMALMKAFTFFSLGFILRSLLDLSVLSNMMVDCPRCPNCDNTIGEDLLQSDIHLQLREPFKPRTMYEVIRYDYFNMSSIMNNFDDDPKTGLLGHQKGDIKDILFEAMVMFNSGGSTRWKMSKLVNGYRRYDPLRGEEYVLDLLLEPENEEFESDSSFHRLEIVKPYGTAQLITQHKINSRDKTLHFILPISASNPKLEQFLANFEDLCLKIDSEMFALLVIFVNPQAATSDARVRAIKEMSSRISKKHHNAHISVVQTRKPFSRALGLDLGAKQLPQNALMFFIDADVLVSPGFVTRCKENTALNRQVYYPIVFTQYDPKIVENYSSKEKYQDLFSINKYTGRWLHYGYGMVCMFAADYRSVGGLDLKIKGWGGEDVDLYKKHVKSSLKVFRAADPGLIHVYHPRSCDQNLSTEQLQMCEDTLAESRGSRQQLGRIITEHHLEV